MRVGILRTGGGEIGGGVRWEIKQSGKTLVDVFIDRWCVADSSAQVDCAKGGRMCETWLDCA